MALFIFKRLTKAYSDRLWLVIVYDYLYKKDSDEIRKAETEYEYKYVTGQLTWPDAREACQEWRGDLASIEDTAEYEKIKQVVTNKDNFWLGANDIKNEGRWEWSDGSKGNYIRELWAWTSPQAATHTTVPTQTWTACT